MPAKKLRLAVAQSRALGSTSETLQALESTVQKAARQGVRLILFPEAYLGGYPRTCTFGASIGGRESQGREQFLRYFQDAVDLGDTPTGAGDDWVERKLPTAKGTEFRGDGTREELERIAKDNDVFIATGVIEKAGGTLYCGVLYVDPRHGTLGKRRKVMPTGSERLVWGFGSPSTLKAVSTVIDGVRLTIAAAICWESYMPMLRQSLYSQNVNLYLAPTADARATWLPLMITTAFESRAFVLSCSQAQKRSHLPDWVTGRQTKVNGDIPNKPQDSSQARRQSVISKHDEHEICWPVTGEVNGVENLEGSESKRRRSSVIIETAEHHEICWPTEDETDLTPTAGSRLPKASDWPILSKQAHAAKAQPTAPPEGQESFLSRGGSCVVSPLGEVLAGPLWDTEEDSELLVVDADFEDCERGRLDLDVAGHYSRNDAFKLTVQGLNLDPPP